MEEVLVWTLENTLLECVLLWGERNITTAILNSKGKYFFHLHDVHRDKQSVILRAAVREKLGSLYTEHIHWFYILFQIQTLKWSITNKIRKWIDIPLYDLGYTIQPTTHHLIPVLSPVLHISLFYFINT